MIINFQGVSILSDFNWPQAKCGINLPPVRIQDGRKRELHVSMDAESRTEAADRRP